MKNCIILLCIIQAFLFSVQGSEDCNCQKVDGGLTEWTRFSPCSVSCGNGFQERVRYCTNPYPQHGGNGCIGNRTQTKPCTIEDCPVNGGWSDFVASSSCSKSCGGGEKTLERSCNNPSPSQCGKKCQGATTKVQQCNTQSCPEWRGPYKCGGCKKQGNKRKCQKVCRQQCYYRDEIVEDSFCSGGFPTKYEHCPVAECLDHTSACDKCHKKALKEAENLGSNYWKNNWVGHACRGSEVNSDLGAICEHVNKSKNNGIISNNWFWIHCSPDGPWCKPCATRNLVFNQKCDACEVTADGPCTK